MVMERNKFLALELCKSLNIPDMNVVDIERVLNNLETQLKREKSKRVEELKKEIIEKGFFNTPCLDYDKDCSNCQFWDLINKHLGGMK